MTRRVVILCGPPGAGKTTAARASGLQVFDRDDPQWTGESDFTDALAQLRADPDARAVVIRSAATSTARAKATRLVGATHVFVIQAPRDELMRRITKRGRHDARQSKAGVDTWSARFDRNDAVPAFPGWPALDEPTLGVVSTDW